MVVDIDGVLKVVPVYKGVPPEAELYHETGFDAVAVNVTLPGPHLETLADTGAAGILSIIASTAVLLKLLQNVPAST